MSGAQQSSQSGMSTATAAMLEALAGIEKEEQQQWAAQPRQGFRRSAQWSSAAGTSAQLLHPEMSPATAAMLSALATIEQEDKQRRGLWRKRSAEQPLAQDVAKRLAADPTAQAPPATAAEDTSSNHSTPEQQYISTQTADGSEMTEEGPQAGQHGLQPPNPAHLHPAGAAPADSTHGADEHPGRAADIDHPPQESAEDLVMSDEQFWAALAQRIAQEARAAQDPTAPIPAETQQPAPAPAAEGLVAAQGPAESEPLAQVPAAAESDESFADFLYYVGAQEAQAEQNAAAPVPAWAGQRPAPDTAAEGLYAAQEAAEAHDAAAPVIVLVPVPMQPPPQPWFMQDEQAAQLQRQHDHLLQLNGFEVCLLRLDALAQGDIDTMALLRRPILHQLWVPLRRALIQALRAAELHNVWPWLGIPWASKKEVSTFMSQDEECLITLMLMEQLDPHKAHFWLRHLALVEQRIASLPRMHQARVPLLLLESYAQDNIDAGLCKSSHGAMQWLLSIWLQTLRTFSPELPQTYWDGLWAAYWEPSVGTARPVFRDMDGKPRPVRSLHCPAHVSASDDPAENGENENDDTPPRPRSYVSPPAVHQQPTPPSQPTHTDSKPGSAESQDASANQPAPAAASCPAASNSQPQQPQAVCVGCGRPARSSQQHCGQLSCKLKAESSCRCGRRGSRGAGSDGMECSIAGKRSLSQAATSGQLRSVRARIGDCPAETTAAVTTDAATAGRAAVAAAAVSAHGAAAAAAAAHVPSTEARAAECTHAPLAQRIPEPSSACSTGTRKQALSDCDTAQEQNAAESAGQQPRNVRARTEGCQAEAAAGHVAAADSAARSTGAGPAATEAVSQPGTSTVHTERTKTMYSDATDAADRSRAVADKGAGDMDWQQGAQRRTVRACRGDRQAAKRLRLAADSAEPAQLRVSGSGARGNKRFLETQDDSEQEQGAHKRAMCGHADLSMMEEM